MKILNVLFMLATLLSLAAPSSAKPEDYYQSSPKTKYERSTDTLEGLLNNGWSIITVTTHVVEPTKDTTIRTVVDRYFLRKDTKVVQCDILFNSTTKKVGAGKMPNWCYKLN